VAGTAGAQPAVNSGLVAAKPASGTTGTSPPPADSGGALKVILIVFAVIVGLVVLCGAVIGFGVWRLASRSHIEADKNGARVETPFGTVESNTDTTAALRKLGVDVYPGARPLPGSAAVNFGGMSTVTGEFETPDSPDLVEAFYKARFPRSNINVSDQNQRTMVFSTNKGMMTIVIEPRGNLTHILISNVGGTKPQSSQSSQPQTN
jgi:hypothetical protein